jgi:hypothetical protein
LDFVSSGTISQDSAGVLTAYSLTGSSVGSTMLAAAPNALGALGAFTSTGGLQLTDAQSLIVSGAVTETGCCITLTTTGAGSNLTFDAPVSDADHTIDLISAGTIAQNSTGTLTAYSLTGNSKGAVTLTAANAIGALAAFTTGNGSFSLSDSNALVVTGAVDAGSGNLALTTTGTSSNLVIEAAVTGDTVDLTAGGEIAESSAGAVTASLLNASANTGIALTSSANDITKIGTDHTNSGPNTIDQK